MTHPFGLPSSSLAHKTDVPNSFASETSLPGPTWRRQETSGTYAWRFPVVLYEAVPSFVPTCSFGHSCFAAAPGIHVPDVLWVIGLIAGFVSSTLFLYFLLFYFFLSIPSFSFLGVSSIFFFFSLYSDLQMMVPFTKCYLINVAWWLLK